LADRHFFDIIDYLLPRDVLVLNDTRVFPARLLGRKKITGGKVDILLLSPTEEAMVWRCLVQPSPKAGQLWEFPGTSAAAVFEKRDTDGVARIRFEGVEDVRKLAEQIGAMPLPPYIKREAQAKDADSYQTVFAEKEGAVAAPTAGLHFTRELLDKLRQKGVQIETVTLHVGYGTFKPVEDLENHHMHSERFELTSETAEHINKAKSEKRGVWAVGTTTLRVLETCVQKKQLIPGKGETDLYIKAPFPFEIADHLITNFHLPKTTLLLLVSAVMGEDFRQKAYAHAVLERYRFYSYGDAMLII